MKRRGGISTHGHWVLLLLILSLALYVVYLSRVFILPLISAAIFSYVSYPFYVYLVKKIHKPKAGAFYTVFILSVIVIVPIIIAIILLARQTVDFVSSTPPDFFSGVVEKSKALLSSTFNIDYSYSNSKSLFELGGEKLKNNLMGYSLLIINGISSFIFQLFFILIFMFYFYIYGPIIYHKFYSVLPFSEINKDIFMLEIKSDIKALFLGQGLVAFIQALFGGIGLFIAGIPNVFLFSFIMFICSFIPMIGSWPVWFPAAIYLLINGNLFSGIFLLIWGIFIVSNIDNLIRPFVISSMSKIDFLVILVGVIIGLKTFNLIGIIVGPLLISILITLIKIYYEESLSDKEKLKVHKKIKKYVKI